MLWKLFRDNKYDPIQDLMDFEPYTCQSSIFFPTQVKLLSACWVLLLPQCNQIARRFSSTCFFFFLRTIILVWRMQMTFLGASDFHTLIHIRSKAEVLWGCVSPHTKLRMKNTNLFSLHVYWCAEREQNSQDMLLLI